MAHLAAAWPDQVLCKENKRRALNEQHESWMRQREKAMAQPPTAEAPAAAVAAPTAAASTAAAPLAAAPVAPSTPRAEHEDDQLDDELDEMNAFLEGVGQSIDALQGSVSAEDTAGMRRAAHSDM